MTRKEKQVRQKAWHAVSAKYASLDHPEWVSNPRLPSLFWHDEHNHKRYIQWLGHQLGYKKPEDWYQITTKDFSRNRGNGFLVYYYCSPFAVVKHHFPNFDWKPWLFRQAPIGWWLDLNNCIAFAKWFEEQRGFKNIEGWYEITQHDVYELKGAGLMDRFNCSVQQFVGTVYPDYHWIPWLFSQVPKKYWNKKKNRIAYMKWLESKLGYTQPKDWLNVTKRDFIDNQGASLMQYGYKTVDLIRELYPQYEWNPWMFRQVYQGYWNTKINRLTYLKWLGQQLGFSSAEDWLKVRHQDLSVFFGTTVIHEHYGNSLVNMVQELFPENRFKPWEFCQVPNGFWDDPKNCRDYLNWLGTRLGFKRLEDWYQVRRDDFKQNSGSGFLKRFKKPYFGLKIAFPDYEWLPWCFKTLPDGFWDNESNLQWYLQWLGEQLNFRSSTDWIGISTKQLLRYYGGRLLSRMSVVEIGRAGAKLLKN